MMVNGGRVWSVNEADTVHLATAPCDHLALSSPLGMAGSTCLHGQQRSREGSMEL